MSGELEQFVVKAVGLGKVFKDFWGRPKARAVNDVDIAIRPGEIVGLLGPNGSGKSTTVKMLLGLLYPTSGILSVMGEPPDSVRAKERIGYLPEESYLYKYLTAEETLDFFGALFGLSGAERKRRIDQLLDMVGMSHARNRRVGEFSKGMARRIGLAQAMINDPDFLILDEPTSGLDPLGVREVKDLILMLKKRGKTVLVTSHLLSDVEDVCDRVVILYGGKIRAEGAIDELLALSDQTQIITPKLNKPELDKVLKILRSDFESGDIQVSNPRRTLEDYFLEVVEQARREVRDSSGAAAGGVADYLSVVDPGRKLAELSEEVPEAEPEAPKTAIEAESEVKNELLSELSGGEKTPTAVPARAATAKKSKELLAKANAKLESLLDAQNKDK